MLVPSDDLVIKKDTALQPGVYNLPHGLTIAADGVTLEGNGALLVGSQRTGRGVTVEGHSRVTIKNLRLQNYYHGLYASRCRELTIEDCGITATAEPPPNTIFLDIWRPADKAYGGGILLEQIEHARIVGNDLQHQMNGLLTYGCRVLTVQRNVANYSSGFGFHLHGTSDCLFEDNYADFCCRYEPREKGSGHLGADSAGFLLVLGSSRNVFRRNYARLGGDGFFLAGLTPEGLLAGCDDNLFEENDGSGSPNNAFEATFCRGNVFRGNQASRSNYGFWLGFSSDNVLEHNQIAHDRQAGIAVENGVNFHVRENHLERNGYGLLLWSKYDDAFARAVPGNDTSRDWWIEDNHFLHNGTAIRIAADQDHGVKPHPQTPSAPRPDRHLIHLNRFRDNRVGIETVQAERPILESNEMAGNVVADTRFDP